MREFIKDCLVKMAMGESIMGSVNLFPSATREMFRPFAKTSTGTKPLAKVKPHN
jgi:hypothetical protein